MATKKIKKKNSSIVTIFILSILVIVGLVLLTTNVSFWFKKSIHGDAKRYATKHCLVFYPNNDYGKQVAKLKAKGVKDNRVYDYSLVPYGDYYLVTYGDDEGYFIDSNNNLVTINEISEFGKRIIADYFRYTLKKVDPDKYYNADFLANSTYDKLDFDSVTYDIKDEYLKCNFLNYDFDVLVPLKYIQNEIGMNFGYKDELYSKPTYVDNDHPVICLTFDDGPDFWDDEKESTSKRIVDTLYKYDATSTFYVVSYALEERGVWTDYQVYSFLTDSINNGNEYGSHTNGHDDLTECTAESVRKTIEAPAKFMKELVNYDMVTYRPPGGSYNEDVKNAQQYAAIFWDIDSDDWYLEDSDAIYQRVLSYKLEDGDVIIFHDIYDETAAAIEKLVPELINRGYQVVTVKDMLKHFNIDVNTLKYYYNLNPSPYYE